MNRGRLEMRQRRAICVVAFTLVAALLSSSAVAQRVTPRLCEVSSVASNGVAVTAIVGPTNGYYIVNPHDATENLYVNPVGVAGVGEGGATAGLIPGQAFYGLPQANSITVNSATARPFICARW